MTGRPVRVVIADDHPPTRYGIRRTLEDVGLVVVAEGADAATAVAQVTEYQPELCLLDLHMPGGGVDATVQIRASAPATAVVILTASRDESDLIDALRAGAVGYLLKDMDPDRLGAALLGVLQGEAAIPRDLVLRVVETVRGGGRHVRTADGRIVALSEREHEILSLLGEGLTTAQVAERLVVAAVTVRTHIASAVRKLRVADRDAAVRLVREG